MSDKFARILKDALSLSSSERVELVDELLASLDSSTQEQIDELWALEVEERIRSIDRGEVELIPMEVAFQELKKRKS